jgi:hypothetical protein
MTLGIPGGCAFDAQNEQRDGRALQVRRELLVGPPQAVHPPIVLSHCLIQVPVKRHGRMPPALNDLAWHIVRQ